MNQITRSLVSGGIFVALAGGVTALAVWDKKSRTGEQEQKDKDKRAFADVKGEDVTEVELVHAGARVAARKEGNDWHISEPIKTPGDDAAFSALVGALTGLEVKHRIEPGKLDAQKVGLGAPETTVHLKTKDGKTLQIHVGNKNTFDDSRYVRVGADAASAPISVVAGHSVTPLQKPFSDLREKRVVSLASNEVDSLDVIQHRAGDNAVSFKAVRSGESGKHKHDDAWKLTAPVVANADRDEIMRIVDGVSGLRALVWVDDEGKEFAKWGLDVPALSIKLGAPGKEQALDIGVVKNGTANKYYARRHDMPNVAEIPAHAYVSAVKDLFGLRDKRVVDFDRDAVHTIVTTLPGGGSVTVQKQPEDSDSEWKVTEPTAGNALGWKVSSLLYQLSNFKVTKFVKEGVERPAPTDVTKPYGLDAPARTLTVRDKDGKDIARVLVGKSEGEETFVMAEGGPFIGTVENQRLADFPATTDDLLDKQPAGDSPAGDHDDDG